MRIIALTVLLFIVVLNNRAFAVFSAKDSAFGNSTRALPEPPRKKYREGEILVKFKAGVSAEKKKNLHKKHGAEVMKDFESLRVQHLKLKKGMTVEEGINLYQADPDVEYAEPNYLYSIQEPTESPKRPGKLPAGHPPIPPPNRP